MSRALRPLASAAAAAALGSVVLALATGVAAESSSTGWTELVALAIGVAVPASVGLACTTSSATRRGPSRDRPRA